MKREILTRMARLLRKRCREALDRYIEDQSDDNSALLTTARSTYWQFLFRHEETMRNGRN